MSPKAFRSANWPSQAFPRIAFSRDLTNSQVFLRAFKGLVLFSGIAFPRLVLLSAPKKWDCRQAQILTFLFSGELSTSSCAIFPLLTFRGVT